MKIPRTIAEYAESLGYLIRLIEENGQAVIVARRDDGEYGVAAVEVRRDGTPDWSATLDTLRAALRN